MDKKQFQKLLFNKKTQFLKNLYIKVQCVACILTQPLLAIASLWNPSDILPIQIYIWHEHSVLFLSFQSLGRCFQILYWASGTIKVQNNWPQFNILVLLCSIFSIGCILLRSPSTRKHTSMIVVYGQYCDSVLFPKGCLPKG